MRQLGLRFLTLGKKSTSHGVSLTRNRRSRLSVECLERRELLAVGTLTGVAYEIDAVTGTDYDGLPYVRSVESTGNLTTASDSLPIAYNEQFAPGYATMNGTVNFTFPQTVTLGQTASISASAQATWNNSGLGFGRPTSIDISDGIGPDGLDDKGSFTNGTTSAQVNNWSDSVAVPTFPGSVTLPAVTVTVDGKEDKIITLTATYQIAQEAPTVTGVSPQTGDPSGGTSVTISGSGFTNASAVSFGDAGATGFTVDSDTQITATAPAGTGTVDVTVTTPTGTSATSGADQFTYVTGGLPQVEFAVANVDVYASGNSVREVDAAVVNLAGSGASPIDAVVSVKPMAKTGGKKSKQAGTPVYIQLILNPYGAALNGVITVEYYVDQALSAAQFAHDVFKSDTGTVFFKLGQTAAKVGINVAVNKIKGAQQQLALALKSPVGAALGTVSQMYLDFINLQYGETQMKNLLKALKRTGNTLRPLANEVTAGYTLSASQQAKVGNLIKIADGLNQTATTYAAIYRSDAPFDSTLEQFQTLYAQLYHLESIILAEYNIP